MPRNEEGSLSADEVYALTAFLLYRNGIIQESDVMDAKSLPKVQMPNRNGFVPLRAGMEARGEPAIRDLPLTASGIPLCKAFRRASLREMIFQELSICVGAALRGRSTSMAERGPGHRR